VLVPHSVVQLVGVLVADLAVVSAAVSAVGSVADSDVVWVVV